MTEETAGTPRVDAQISVHDEASTQPSSGYIDLTDFARQLEREVAALTTQRDEANTRFEDHTKAVAEWTSTAAEIIGLGEHGKVTPDQILDQLIYGRQWASDMQTKLTAAEAELDAAKRYAALNISDLHDKLHASELNCQSLHAALDAAKRALAFPDVPPRSVIDAINEHAYSLYCGAHPDKDANALALYMSICAALAAKSTEQSIDTAPTTGGFWAVGSNSRKRVWVSAAKSPEMGTAT